MERIQNFSFEVEYRKGASIPHVDALSRHREDEEVNLIQEDKTMEILKMHEIMIHRGAKAIYEKFREQGNQKHTELEIREAIKDCRMCKAYNPIRSRKFRKIEAFIPREKVGIDIMEPRRGLYIASAIDYFTRKGFSKPLRKKTAEEVLKFVEDIYKEFPFKMLVSDGAKENTSVIMKRWLKQNGIVQHITSPYHHQSNGRVERFNRTILESFNKLRIQGSVAIRVKKVVEQYNDSYYRVLRMTPNQAQDEQNWEKIKRAQFEDRIADNLKHLGNKPWPRLREENKVLVREELQQTKDQQKFKTGGEIVTDLGYDTYMIKDSQKQPF